MPPAVPPYPFKLAIFKNAVPKDSGLGSWGKVNVTFFDCAEDPIALIKPGTMLELSRFCHEALTAIGNIAESLNSDAKLERPGASWIVQSVHIDWKVAPHSEFAIVYGLVDRPKPKALFGSVPPASSSLFGAVKTTSGSVAPASSGLFGSVQTTSVAPASSSLFGNI
ncbi:hypothetical protein DRE_06817 [Drechslerella stenobrocha 248]|uniref:Uncharacterized protein n=1 Tax=Drechslerella stenobrocha 248 TaxID=1043628 RepID=W7HMV9_9PEZI|nr:hypothetical protein DRE_06817 [Drechslerella stenobrocha 248]